MGDAPIPLFSIIITAYNRAALIGRTIQSVLNQAMVNQEIIVVDDGSADGTLDVVSEYRDQVRLLRQANGGPGAARNTGLRAASGEYVAFLDSDDLWFPWTAGTYAHAIAENNRPAFIAGKPFMFKSDHDPLPDHPEEFKTEVFADYLASGDTWRRFSASSFVMNRKSLVSVGGFTEESVNNREADCALRMGVAGRFVQITSPYTFASRQHADSARSDLLQTVRSVRRLIEQTKRKKYPGSPTRYRDQARIVSMHSRALAYALLEANQYTMAWDLYRQTVAWNIWLCRWRFALGFPIRALTLSAHYLPGERESS